VARANSEKKTKEIKKRSEKMTWCILLE